MLLLKLFRLHDNSGSNVVKNWQHLVMSFETGGHALFAYFIVKFYLFQEIWRYGYACQS